MACRLRCWRRRRAGRVTRQVWPGAWNETRNTTTSATSPAENAHHSWRSAATQRTATRQHHRVGYNRSTINGRNAMTDILIGRNDSASVSLDPHYGNRHGMIAGATGTGKSVSLMMLAEGFSRLGVPCFLADAKGDLAGLSIAAAEAGDKLRARLEKLKLTDWKPLANPVVFWDIYGKLGHPVRATISEMGPTLLGHVLELNDTQEGVLEVIFKAADDQGW